MHVGSWESAREAFEWHEAKSGVCLACRVLSQLPKYISNIAGIFFARFLYGACVHLNLDRLTLERLLNQFRRILYLISLRSFILSKLNKMAVAMF